MVVEVLRGDRAVSVGDLPLYPPLFLLAGGAVRFREGPAVGRPSVIPRIGRFLYLKGCDDRGRLLGLPEE